jgi:hypothetical protein
MSVPSRAPTQADARTIQDHERSGSPWKVLLAFAKLGVSSSADRSRTSAISETNLLSGVVGLTNLRSLISWHCAKGANSHRRATARQDGR